MWAGVVFVLLVGVPACRGTGYNAYQGYEAEEGGDADLYDNYSDDVHRNPTTATSTGVHTRNKRYDDPDDIRSLDIKDQLDVKGSLNKILYGNKLESLITHPQHRDYTEVYDYVDKSDSRGQKLSASKNWWGSGVQKWSPVTIKPKTLLTRSSKYDQKEVREELQKLMSPAAEVPRKWLPLLDARPSTAEEETLMFSDVTQDTPETRTYNNEEVKEDIKKLLPQGILPGESTMIEIQHSSPSLVTTTGDYMVETLSITMKELTEQADTHTSRNVETQMGTLRSYTGKTASRSTNKILRDDDDGKTIPDITPITTTTATTAAPTTTTTTTPPTTTTETTTTTIERTTKQKMDINAIIAIIANLTYDYDWNLTEQFNKTLIDHGVPTCPTPSTPTTTSTTPPEYDFANTSVVGKCFVCGLKSREIPRNAFCADAFAGDFLPLMPVDPRARSRIASFRKYCRHLDVHNYVENPLEPRSIYGRFTGGCGVRWTDMSGVYTQRTCRSRFRPLTGRHFGSKRMAKLELALVNVENGCIISPMATLLPLSRGVSLYARFHACVCTGSWCNTAIHFRITTPTLVVRALLALLAYIR